MSIFPPVLVLSFFLVVLFCIIVPLGFVVVFPPYVPFVGPAKVEFYVVLVVLGEIFVVLVNEVEVEFYKTLLTVRKKPNLIS